MAKHLPLLLLLAAGLAAAARTRQVSQNPSLQPQITLHTTDQTHAATASTDTQMPLCSYTETVFSVLGMYTNVRLVGNDQLLGRTNSEFRELGHFA